MDLRDTRLTVIEIQQSLLELFQAGVKIPYVTPDGIYGSLTRQAVSDFQSLNGMKSTGVVDINTWNALRDQALKAFQQRSAALGIYPFAAVLRGSCVGQGEVSDLVRIIQIMLNSLSLYDLEGGSLSGTYDDTTMWAIQKFQKIHGINQNGTVDLETWNALAIAYNSAVGGSDDN